MLPNSAFLRQSTIHNPQSAALFGPMKCEKSILRIAVTAFIETNNHPICCGKWIISLYFRGQKHLCFIVKSFPISFVCQDKRDVWFVWYELLMIFL
jgi:hypothetical protein